jgi:hypothetical protein
VGHDDHDQERPRYSRTKQHAEDPGHPLDPRRAQDPMAGSNLKGRAPVDAPIRRPLPHTGPARGQDDPQRDQLLLYQVSDVVWTDGPPRGLGDLVGDLAHGAGTVGTFGHPVQQLADL